MAYLLLLLWRKATHRRTKEVNEMKTQTHLKAGRLASNHNETLVREGRRTRGLKVKCGVKAGKKAK
jgi:hypothetical protein